MQNGIFLWIKLRKKVWISFPLKSTSIHEADETKRDRARNMGMYFQVIVLFHRKSFTNKVRETKTTVSERNSSHPFGFRTPPSPLVSLIGGAIPHQKKPSHTPERMLQRRRSIVSRKKKKNRLVFACEPPQDFFLLCYYCLEANWICTHLYSPYSSLSDLCFLLFPFYLGRRVQVHLVFLPLSL